MEKPIELIMASVGESPIEWAAVACGILNVWLIIRRSMWNYPFGFATSAMYVRIFWEARLYADSALQVYFLTIQVYGLWYWLRGRASDGRVIVAPLRMRMLAVYLGISVGGWSLLAFTMERFTDAAYPFWDAAVAALSAMAQFLLSRRHLESWLLWIAVDVIAIGLFLARGLAPTALLYVVFLCLAISGWFEWRRSLHATGSAMS